MWDGLAAPVVGAAGSSGHGAVTVHVHFTPGPLCPGALEVRGLCFRCSEWEKEATDGSKH